MLNIFKKVVNHLTLQEKQSILNNYIGIKYERGFEYSLFWKIFGVITLLVLFMLWRYQNIYKYNKKINKYLNMIDKNILISFIDTEGDITYISDALCKLIGYKKEDIIGKKHNIFQHQDVSKSKIKNIWDTIKQEKTWKGEIKNVKKDGSPFWTKVTIKPNYNEENRLKGYTIIRYDVTIKKELKKTTLTDTLTQIPNGLHLDNNYKNEVERAKRYNGTFSLILIDNDLFKNINDNYGHQVGDVILKEIASILKNNISKLDILNRWGGEEFLIICPEIKALNAQILAKKIKDKIEQHGFTTTENITCSFGVSQYISDDKNKETFHRADKAFYIVKESGRNRIIIV